jgi:hypothetical protein
MPRLSKEQELANLHAEAVREFDDIQKATHAERLQALQDRRFYSIAGAQWEGDVGDLYENKARFEFNHVHLAVIRVVNEYRNNRVTVDFQPTDGAPNDDFADTCDGLYRADEQRCSANEAYDNAFEEGTSGGMGAWRLRSCYEDEEDEDDERQRISIEPIFDADTTVFYDLDAKRQDKADAKRCYVLTPYSRDAYEAEFDDDPSSWPHEVSQLQFDWCTADLVWVAERYSVEETKEQVRFYTGLLGDEGQEELKVTQDEIDSDPGLIERLRVTGYTLARTKNIKRRRIRKVIMSGSRILEDCGYIAGRCIPIVPFYGKRWMVDGVERFMGHVRLARDPQRLINMIMSWLAEMAARFDVEKPIFDPEQIAGHEQMWSNDSIERWPYLLANAQKDKQTGSKIPGSQVPAAYTKAPNIPPAMAALAQMAQQALQDLLGNQQAGEQMQPNLSGKAVELIQNRLDMQVFIYMSNFAKAMKRSGEVWLSMMRDVAVEESRRMKTVSTNGQSGSTVVNEPVIDEKTSKRVIRNEFAKASYDVVADVGPSSTSLRNAVVRALTGIASVTEDPETKQALTLATISNLEGEGLGDLRDWGRARAVRMGLIKPNDEEKAELAQEQASQKPDPQQQYLMAAAAEAEGKAKQAEANTVLTVVKAEQARAETAKTLAEIDTEKQQQVIDAVNAFQQAAQPPAGFDPMGQ